MTSVSLWRTLSGREFGKILSHLLVSSLDPVTFASVVALHLPARRALRAGPMEALRAE